VVRGKEKSIWEARFEADNESYSKLGTKEGENTIYKLVKTREMKRERLEVCQVL
jgi:hypothetical protein